jgi:hypothetical protein
MWICPLKPYDLHSSSTIRSGTSAPFLGQTKYIFERFGVYVGTMDSRGPSGNLVRRVGWNYGALNNYWNHEKSNFLHSYHWTHLKAHKNAVVGTRSAYGLFFRSFRIICFMESPLIAGFAKIQHEAKLWACSGKTTEGQASPSYCYKTLECGLKCCIRVDLYL